MINARLRVYLLAIAAGLLIAVIFTLSANGMVAQAVTVSLVVLVITEAAEHLDTERRKTAAVADQVDEFRPEPDDLAHSDEGEQVEDSPGPDESESAIRDLVHRRQPAYDAVYAYIRTLPVEPTPSRNAHIWHAVGAALDAMHVGQCVSSHCVEGDHVVWLEPTP
ncbi:hypothetical protein [Streptomyces rubiginosohelvolus]|uniref:Secreted protein n=1 Tax=Streptomyces rubiginosohelvolus TaxID=67362 RepID=A0ABQ3BMS1_9ACTN|nr:hypothetical protein [Streptomyces pluricolorescens]GGZ51574.1 hypothetical protein GCM10010328_27790 [Streptomyces pluricolorescens]